MQKESSRRLQELLRSQECVKLGEDPKETVIFKQESFVEKILIDSFTFRARPEKSNVQMTDLSTNSFDTDLNGYLSQYLNAEAAITNKASASDVPNVVHHQTKPAITSISSALKKCQQDKSIRVEHETTVQNERANESHDSTAVTIKKSNESGVFLNKTFQIIGFDEAEIKDLEKVLLSKGANILVSDLNQSRIKEKIDYTLLPMTLPAAISNNNPVTIYWMVNNLFFELTLLQKKLL